MMREHTTGPRSRAVATSQQRVSAANGRTHVLHPSGQGWGGYRPERGRLLSALSLMWDVGQRTGQNHATRVKPLVFLVHLLDLGGREQTIFGRTRRREGSRGTSTNGRSGQREVPIRGLTTAALFAEGDRRRRETTGPRPTQGLDTTSAGRGAEGRGRAVGMATGAAGSTRDVIDTGHDRRGGCGVGDAYGFVRKGGG